jgi:hypothetical protein
MKKHVLLSLLGLSFLAVAPNADAVIAITLSGNPTTGPQFVVGAGTSNPVPDGSLIRIGTFEAAPNVNGTFAEYAAAFQEFGRTTVGHTTASAPVNQGRVNRANISGNNDPVQSPQPDTYFLGRTVYIWVYNSATEDPLAPQGIFSTSQAVFTDALSSTSTSVNQYLTPAGRFPAPLGTQTSVDTSGNLVTVFHLAVVIPEPASTAMFGLLAALGLMRRRR